MDLAIPTQTTQKREAAGLVLVDMTYQRPRRDNDCMRDVSLISCGIQKAIFRMYMVMLPVCYSQHRAFMRLTTIMS